MGVVVPLRSHQGEFLAAQRSTSTDFLVCPAVRRQRVGLSVPLGTGGLRLLSAVRIREAADWASWADSLPMVHQRHPEVARMVVGGLARGVASCFTDVRGCVQSLVDVGFEPPEWESLLVDARPQLEEEEDPTQPLAEERCVTS